jgi:hypothetical protein
LRPPLEIGLGLGLLSLAAALPWSAGAAAPAKACSRSIVVTGDYESFRQAGHDVRPAQFSALVALARDRFNAAARRLCAAAILRPADLARFGRLVVQNGEGATEPLIYQDESSARDIFIFQYAFQEGGPPSPAEFERALRCWKRPQSRGCDIGD